MTPPALDGGTTDGSPAAQVTRLAIFIAGADEVPTVNQDGPTTVADLKGTGGSNSPATDGNAAGGGEPESAVGGTAMQPDKEGNGTRLCGFMSVPPTPAAGSTAQGDWPEEDTPGTDPYYKKHPDPGRPSDSPTEVDLNKRVEPGTSQPLIIVDPRRLALTTEQRMQLIMDDPVLYPIVLEAQRQRVRDQATRGFQRYIDELRKYPSLYSQPTAGFTSGFERDYYWYQGSLLYTYLQYSDPFSSVGSSQTHPDDAWIHYSMQGATIVSLIDLPVSVFNWAKGLWGLRALRGVEVGKDALEEAQGLRAGTEAAIATADAAKLENAAEAAENIGRGVEDGKDLFAGVRGRNLSQLDRKEIGDLGEDIAKRFLQDNKYTDIFAVQNKSGNGIDIVARTPDGRLAFFEVKTSSVGTVGGLSARQANMTDFVRDILRQASTGTGRYKGLDVATQNRAAQMLREFNLGPQNASGTVIGVDLFNEIIRVSPW